MGLIYWRRSGKNWWRNPRQWRRSCLRVRYPAPSCRQVRAVQSARDSTKKEEIKELHRESKLEIQWISSFALSVSDDHSNTSSKRDEDRAEVINLRQKLNAARANLDVSHVDYRRSSTDNTNLQDALHAFQTKREAKTQIYKEVMTS